MESVPLQKKRVFLWTLYDFANSIAIIVFTLYFSQWLVIDQGVQDLWYNLLFVGSTILVFGVGPVMGIIADKRGVQMPYLRLTTTLQFIALVVASILAVAFPEHHGVVILAALAFMVANFLYQLTFIFYNALLPNIAPPERHGHVSGIGQAGNFLGSVTGLVLTLPLATGAIYLFGNPGRAQTFLPSVILFFVLALPALILLKDTREARNISVRVAEEYRNFFQSFRSLIQNPGLGRYLLAFFFFNDAMLTAQNNIAIYLEQVFHVVDKTKSFFFLGVLLTSVVGALVSGRIADKIGLKRSLMILLSCWTAFFLVLGMITSFVTFAVFAAGMGFLFGATWTVTRAVMAYLTPVEHLNEGFSWYTLAERFSTFIGPLAWGLITYLLLPQGVFRYHVAMASMSAFVLIGLLIARKIPSDKKTPVVTVV